MIDWSINPVNGLLIRGIVGYKGLSKGSRTKRRDTKDLIKGKTTILLLLCEGRK